MNTYYAVGRGAVNQVARPFRDMQLPGRHLARILDHALHEASLRTAAIAYRQLSEKSGKSEKGVRMSQEAEQKTDLSVPPFDPVYPRLVTEGGRPQEKILGLLAYGLYQEAKREWISDFFSRDKRYPNRDELRTYDLSWTTSRLEGLHNGAAQLIAAYTDTIVADTEREALRNALRGGFWRTVWRWVVGATLYTSIVVGLILGLNKWHIDWVSMLTPQPH
jgi:hypothetical protein